MIVEEYCTVYNVHCTMNAAAVQCMKLVDFTLFMTF